MQPDVDSPVVDPYSPAPHSVHTPAPPTEYCPTAHTDAVLFVDPAPHAYPALHAPPQLLVVSPAVAPYTPAPHMLHTLDPGPLHCPATQTAAVLVVDPAGQRYPALQLPEHTDVDRPATAPY